LNYGPGNNYFLFEFVTPRNQTPQNSSIAILFVTAALQPLKVNWEMQSDVCGSVIKWRFSFYLPYSFNLDEKSLEEEFHYCYCLDYNDRYIPEHLFIANQTLRTVSVRELRSYAAARFDGLVLIRRDVYNYQMEVNVLKEKAMQIMFIHARNNLISKNFKSYLLLLTKLHDDLCLGDTHYKKYFETVIYDTIQPNKMDYYVIFYNNRIIYIF
jgi:hypothetical protein